MLFNFLNWTWDEGFEDFIRTGKPARIHQEMSHDEWRVYQRAMRSLANFSAFEVARRTPVPRGALHMLDIGGSPRHYAGMFFCCGKWIPVLFTKPDTLLFVAPPPSSFLAFLSPSRKPRAESMLF